MDRNKRDKDTVTSWFPDDILESDIESIPIRILIAEDDSATLNLLKKSLESNGFDVTAVRDGNAAWEVLQDIANSPELAILDWMMPGLDGIELCKKIKARKTPFVFTILITAKVDETDIIEGLEAGAHEFLSKPFDVNVLKARVIAGARIVRLEKALQTKSSILKEYAKKLEKQAWGRTDG
ncbi:MAG: response regulator transcription factor [Proteobacteria bacterium]|nr:response regulator transcription factor [Pseudomonadota bacterium]